MASLPQALHTPAPHSIICAVTQMAACVSCRGSVACMLSSGWSRGGPKVLASPLRVQAAPGTLTRRLQYRTRRRSRSGEMMRGIGLGGVGTVGEQRQWNSVKTGYLSMRLAQSPGQEHARPTSLASLSNMPPSVDPVSRLALRCGAASYAQSVSITTSDLATEQPANPFQVIKQAPSPWWTPEREPMICVRQDSFT